jgi:hypothetical protein
MTDKPKEEVTVVYLGEYLLKGGGKGHAFCLLSDFDPQAKRSAQLAKAGMWKDRRSFTLGACYKGPGSVDGDGRLQTLGLKRLTYRDKVEAPWFAEAEAEAATAAVIERANALEKKVKANSALNQSVKALGDLYAVTRYQDRTALELLLLAMIRRAAL